MSAYIGRDGGARLVSIGLIEWRPVPDLRPAPFARDEAANAARGLCREAKGGGCRPPGV
jgi:hypothetical protein